MISYEMQLQTDKELFHLLETNDKNFSKGRAIITLNKQKQTIRLVAKDLAAFRAAHKSIENTLLLWEKAKGAI